MGSYDLFIKRPILTLMLTLSLIVFGVLGYQRLGVDQFPNMEFPIVTVSAQLEGASPEVIEQDVTDVLEEHLNTIAGVRQIRSKSYHGTSIITVEFELGREIDVAAQDVRDKVARARYELPEDVEPPVVDKEDFGNEPVLWVPVNSDRPLVEASEYVRHFMKPRLETIQGVASVVMFGERERAIRIWIDGEELRARGLAATDILEAVRREHVELPGGEVESHRVEYSVKTDAEFRTVDELKRLIVAYTDGAPVRLEDVARVEDGAADPRTIAHFDGVPTVGIGIRKQSGGNTVAVVDETYRRLDEMRALLPAGYSFKGADAAADFSKAIRESVDETQFALVFGALLAVLTVFVFLRRTRPTLIVAAAIPISLIATFGVMWMFGFTLNTMTLLALALAVGVVIDDAIIVLENIERHRELGEEPFEAASKGTREIAFAATASTVSIAVVFMPVIFVEGLVGSFLGDFGVTVAAAVFVSLIVALTLTPMLAARMPPPKAREHGSIYHRLEQGFVWLETHYRTLIGWAIVHRKTTLGIAVGSFALALGFGRMLGTEFFPPSDNGMFFVRFTTPPGTTLETTREFLRRNEAWMLQQPELAGMFAGVGIGERRQGGSSNEGMLFAILKSKRDRDRTTQELVPLAREALARIPGQQARVFDLSNMMGNVSGGDFAFEIRGNIDLLELDELSDRFMAELQKRGGYYDLDKSLKLGLPEVRVVPDREKAAALGVDARSLALTIQAMIGGLDIATFKEGGRRYDIRVRLAEDARNDPASIQQLFVRTRDGGVVELRNLVDVQVGAAPSAITRMDRQRSVTVSGNLEEKELGTAVAEAREIAAEILPEGVSLGLSGQAEAFQEGVAAFGLALGLAVLVIYMVLAAQFESLSHPLTVMLALPLALVGAFGGLFVRGMTLNLFSLIGMILLMGLVTKNSILLIDYANQLRAEGLDKVEAMRRAAPVRMRPVLMTAVSMIFGVLPAAIGVGPGAETRGPMAVASGAGMLSSTLLTLVVVPVFYLTLDDAILGVRRRLRRLFRRGEPAPQSSPAHSDRAEAKPAADTRFPVSTVRVGE
jgi:HAE1 family hydrophobic/amphiphilic exporter-1